MTNGNVVQRWGSACVSRHRSLRLIGLVTDWLRSSARPGSTTLDIDALSSERRRDLGFCDGRPVRPRSLRD